ncbi:protein CASPARIAN STRIP INTEGRITY FACTOR 2-like [Carya illinoinensis]|nr:protein CASPARIAN STRIP INTEGRITY FACTOR 2-like [Carya illinoinensis]
MGLIILLKKSSLLFLILASVLLSTCLAVRLSMPVISELAKEADALLNEGIPQEDLDIISVHERLLRANTKDYGKYDPAPALVKPPFKLIPN